MHQHYVWETEMFVSLNDLFWIRDNTTQLLLHLWCLIELSGKICTGAAEHYFDGTSSNPVFDYSFHKPRPHHYKLLIMLTSCRLCCLGLNLYWWRATTRLLHSQKITNSWRMHPENPAQKKKKVFYPLEKCHSSAEQTCRLLLQPSVYIHKDRCLFIELQGGAWRWTD